MKFTPPEGAVILGVGGSFKLGKKITFPGWCRKANGKDTWGGKCMYLAGNMNDLVYAVPSDSPMAKLNGLHKDTKKPKQVIKGKVSTGLKGGPLDPKGIPQHEPGAKMDAGKPMAGLLWGFSRALEAVVKVGTYGAKKYTRDGWNHVPDAIQRYQDAADRHTLAMAREELDPESGMPHEWHALWNRMAVLELKLRQQNQTKP